MLTFTKTGQETQDTGTVSLDDHGNTVLDFDSGTMVVSSGSDTIRIRMFSSIHFIYVSYILGHKLTKV
jgi:hypothetical protein